VWFGTQLVGALVEGDDGQLRFTYDAAWLDDGFPISLSLPLREDPPRHNAHAFFAGLLPEAATRTRIARERRIPEADDFGLLLEIGRDCAGALSVLPEDELPETQATAPATLTPGELERLLLSRGHSVPDQAHPRRFSLAGAQDKVAVIVQGERYALPDHAHPSNAILKFETIRWVCFAERAGNALAHRLGLEVVPTHYRLYETDPYLLVERYDRYDEGGLIRRLHQEDLTQALGFPSHCKYESDGGSSLAQIAELLRQHALDPVRDVERLRDWQLFNYLAGNYDGHAKNLSLLYAPGVGAPTLAPFYDLVCIEFMNRIGVSSYDRSLAFSIAGRAEPESIRAKDWEQWSKDMSLPPRRVLERLEELATSAPSAARAVREALAADHGDRQAHDYFEQTVGDRSRWVLSNVTSARRKR